MKLYDTIDLSQPETYQNDAELATLARRTADSFWHLDNSPYRQQYEKFAMLRDDFFAGKFAEQMREAVHRVWSEQNEQTSLDESNRQIVKTLKFNGYTFELENKTILIRGQFDQDLHSRLKRQGATWEGADSRLNRKLWVLPLAAAPSLARVLANFQIARAKRLKSEADAAELKRQAETAKRQAQEKQWAEERAARERQRAAERAIEDVRKQRAMASRVKVRVGQHKLGAQIADAHGKVRAITGFGTTWSESLPDPTWGQHGTRYDEPCAICGRESVIDNDSECCERCAGGDSVSVCYAYFE